MHELGHFTHYRNVPPSIVWNIITNCVDLTELKRELNKYAGTGSGKYYSTSQLATYIADYEYWFDHSNR